jgi:hypothetical protein
MTEEEGRPEAASQSPGANQDLKATLGQAGDSTHADVTARPMTKGDRTKLEQLARKRAAVAKSMIGERIKVLRADVEDQLTTEYKFDEAIWADINKQAQREVSKADAEIAAICARIGVPENLRPSLSLGWHNRGENALASRRTELRKLAYARIDAGAESAKVAIAANLLDVETELITGGLETAEAAAFVASMPTPEQLLPPVSVGELKPGSRKSSKYSKYDTDSDEWRGSYGGWEPPMEAAASLLTPTSATGREAKRQAFAAALAANPNRSDREIGRLAGVDHKTVGKWRAESGEIPSESEEIPEESP